MLDQLTIDGRAVAFPVAPPRRLTERQRDLLRFMRQRMEYGLPTTTAAAAEFYVTPSGALRRLEALGLVKRASRGCWYPT